jgi:myo-inositol-1(or 4)-monophosphatase
LQADLTLDRWLNLAESAALLAGDHLRRRSEAWSQLVGAEEHDVKIAADRLSETLILEALQGGSPFAALSEEAGHVAGSEPAGPVWVVDPLDGSLNYHRGIPPAGVSIALCRGEEPLLGVIFDFTRNELFSGIPGRSATLNRSPIRVSGTARFSDAVLGTGFPSYADYSDEALMTFVRQVQRYRKVRSLGSAALMLAYVANGRLDAYHETGIKLWDVAAGVAIVRAAGGAVTVSAGRDPTRNLEVVATNGRLATSR